nr:DUF6680 family protein [Sphingomonas sp. 37zxx]
MIPVDFNRQQTIMAAWEKYMEAVYYKASPDNLDRHNQEMLMRQTKLIFEITRFMRYDIAESDLEKRSYSSQSFVDRDQLNVQAQVAWIRIANALEQQNQAAGLATPAEPEALIPQDPSALDNRT